MPAETIHYRDRTIAVASSELQQKLPDGDYIVVPFAGGFALMIEDGTLMSGAVPLAEQSEGVALAKRLIDDSEAQEARWRQQSLQAPVASAPVPHARSPLFGNPENTRVSLSLQSLIAVCNALPEASEARMRLLNDFCQANGNEAAGLVTGADGVIRFDARRYSMQIYRAKQQRMAESALRRLKDAARDLSDVNDYLQNEADVAALPGVVGEPLVDMRKAPSVLNAVAPALDVLLHGMKNVQAVAGGRSPVLDQADSEPPADENMPGVGNN